MNLEIYYKREGKWTIVFITGHKRGQFGDIIGHIYNMRRKHGNKRVRICKKNLQDLRVNPSTYYEMRNIDLLEFKRYDTILAKGKEE
jgi:hypothetical protein